MKKREMQLGKWYFKFGILPTFWKSRGYRFHFGIFKMLECPPEGEMITKKQYKGFWIRKEFDWQGFEISF